MMEKKRRKRGENSYLNDFHLNLAGEYIYDGELYACQADPDTQKMQKRKLWVYTALMLLTALASGSIPAPGMLGSSYVILPFLGELIAIFSVVWAVCKLGRDWNAVREYVYERTLPALPGRALCVAAFAAAGILCELLYVILSGHGGQLFYAFLFVILKVISLICALTIRRKLKCLNWAKVPKCENQ